MQNDLRLKCLSVNDRVVLQFIGTALPFLSLIWQEFFRRSVRITGFEGRVRRFDRRKVSFNCREPLTLRYFVGRVLVQECS